VDSAFSSVRKTDVRVTNGASPAVRAVYSTPYYSSAYASPAVRTSALIVNVVAKKWLQRISSSFLKSILTRMIGPGFIYPHAHFWLQMVDDCEWIFLINPFKFVSVMHMLADM